MDIENVKMLLAKASAEVIKMRDDITDARIAIRRSEDHMESINHWIHVATQQLNRED